MEPAHHMRRRGMHTSRLQVAEQKRRVASGRRASWRDVGFPVHISDVDSSRVISEDDGVVDTV